MPIKVFHLPDELLVAPTFMPNRELKAFVKHHRPEYIHVADVYADEYEDAFFLTNSIYDHWSRNRKVEAKVADCRSTSVGDLFVKGNEEVVVTNFGFETIT